MPRYFIHSAAVATFLGVGIAIGAAAPAVAAVVQSPLIGGFAGVLSPAQPQQVTIVRDLDGVQLAETASGSSARDRSSPSANPSPAARGPIGSQGTSGNTLGTTGGMTGGMRSEEGMRSGRVPSEQMMNQSQPYPAAPAGRQPSAMPQQQQQQEGSWWKPWTWGGGMRSQQELRQEQQRLPSSGAATRNPRYENETVVEQPWRAPDVPGGERGQTATGRESRVFGGSPAQSNPSTGSDYFGRQPRQQQPPAQQQ